MLDTSEAVTFAETVPAGGDVELAYELDGPATVEKLKLRFYPGQQLALEVRPLFREAGSGREYDIVDMNGDEVFTGDDDVYEYDLSKPVPDNNEIVVRVNNTDPSYDYDFRVNAEVDYRFGRTAAILGKIGGML